jgi:acetyl-CoA carboxylase carboxyltransferase component
LRVGARRSAKTGVIPSDRIDGRPVVVGADDFTVRGGAADAAIWQKQLMSEQMANEMRLPLARLVDGTANQANAPRNTCRHSVSLEAGCGSTVILGTKQHTKNF